MHLYKQPTSITTTFSPKEYWLRECNDSFGEVFGIDTEGLADYCLTVRIDMSYCGKPDQEGNPVLFLSEKDAQVFIDSGFDVIK